MRRSRQAAPNRPVFAFLYERLSRAAERLEGPHRAAVCGQARGLVVELGAGTGLNFAYYDQADRVIAVEPDAHMRARAVARAAAATVPVSVVGALAERLPLRTAAVDTVVVSLALCSVFDVDAALAECHRVLRPTGTLRFYEHVRSHRPAIARWQDLLERPWGFVAGGCHPNRDPVASLRRAGFRVRAGRVDAPGPVAVVLPHVLGEARPVTRRQAEGQRE